MEVLNQSKSWVEIPKTAGLSAKGNYSRHKGNKGRQDVGGGCHLRLFFEVIDIVMLFY